MQGWRSRSDDARDAGGNHGYGSSTSNWRSRSQQQASRQDQAKGTGRSTASMNWRTKDSAPPTKQREEEGEEAGTAASTSRLFVGNLLYTAESSDVSDIFRKNGFEVDEVNMSIDPMTGRNPSYCFVEMKSIEDATAAVGVMNGVNLLDRPLKIKPAFPKDGVGATSSRMKASGRNWKERGAEEGYRPTYDRYNRTDAERHWDAPVREGRRLFVGGLPRMQPQSAMDMAMQELFDGFELSVVSKLIVPTESLGGVDSHYLFADLVSADDVEPCIRKLNGMDSPWGKGRLTVTRAKDNKNRKVMREQDVRF